MPKVRQAGAEKWQRRAAAASTDYTAGVQAPRQSWQQATLAAEAAHTAGLQAAIQGRRFSKGVAKSSDQRWQTRAASIGAPRFAQGVAAAGQDYEAAVTPYLRVIESTPLPPRGPKGDPNNIQRVAKLAAALHQAKTGSTR